MLGSGAIIVIDDRCCMVQLGLRVAQFYMHESCGKCTPCREGTRWMVQILDAIEEGRPRRPISTCCSTCATGSSASASARSATRPRCRSRATSTSSATSSRRTSTRGCPMDGELVARARPRAGRPAHPPSGRRGAGVSANRCQTRARLESGTVSDTVPETSLAPVDEMPRLQAERVSAEESRNRHGCVRVMSAAEVAKVTIDDREIEVAKGTGLVETAAAAGIEIPVFCYEPRLGPAVGACRMCLVEIEGVPKLQAGCTLTAQDGMVVRTAQSSGARGRGPERDARVHPRQPPARLPGLRQGRRVPAPGPDVQVRPRPDADDVSRSGRSRSRSRSRRRSRSTASAASSATAARASRRTSSEDGQLVARNRGAQSMITTFEDEPYRAPFSGNVIELCPVGALTSTQYRFEARPWEIQNVPTVCGLCPVGCNITRDDARGQGEADPLAQPPRDRPGLALRQGPLRLPAPVRRGPDHGAAAARRAGAASRPISWDDALDRAEELLRGAEGRIVTALSGSETVEQAYALGKLMRQGLGASSAVLPEATSTALDAFRAPLSAIGRAQIVVVIGEDAVAERAPVVDLWIKLARRNGAEVVHVAEPKLGKELEAARVGGGPGGPRLVRARRRRRRAARRARAQARPRRQARLGRVPAARHPERPRRRRRLGVRRRGGGREPGADRPADRLGRRGRGRPGRARARRARGERARDHDVPGPRGRLGRSRPARAPPTSSATAPSSTSKAASSGCAAPSSRPCRTSSPGSRSSPSASTSRSRRIRRPSSRSSPSRLYGGMAFGEVGERARLPERTPYEAPEPAPPAPHRRSAGARPASTSSATCACSATGRSSPARRSSACPSSPSSARPRRSSSPTPTPSGGASRTATRSPSARTGRASRCAPASAAALPEGTARIAEEHAADLHRDVEVVKA